MKVVILIVVMTLCVSLGFSKSILPPFRGILSSIRKNVGNVDLADTEAERNMKIIPKCDNLDVVNAGTSADYKLYDSKDNKDVIRALQLAGISIAQKAITLSMFGVFWLLFIRSLGTLAETISSSIKYMQFQNDGNFNGTMSENMSMFLEDGAVLTGEETAILAQCKLPGDISDTLQDLGGLQSIKEVFLRQYFISPVYKQDNQTSVTWVHRALQSRNSALLYGPPGCGKSTLIRSICRHLQCPMLEITPSMIQHRFFGDSTKTLRAVFSLMKKMKRCVIFIDEIDALFSKRHEFEASHDRAIKTELMQLWDGLLRDRKLHPNIFIFGATNRPQDIDPAILRRFEQSFHLSLPDKIDREAIWRTLLRDVPINLEKFDFHRCARLTEGYSASDIGDLCTNVISYVMTKSDQQNKSLPTIFTEDVEHIAKGFVPTAWAAYQYAHTDHYPGERAYSHGERNKMSVFSKYDYDPLHQRYENNNAFPLFNDRLQPSVSDHATQETKADDEEDSRSAAPSPFDFDDSEEDE